MNLSELSDLLGRSTDVLRVETLDAYNSGSDGDMVDAYLRGEAKPDPEAKRPWLDRLAAAAERGHPWRRLRVVPRPVPDYVRYACEWGYVDNVAAGEDVRVLDDVESVHLDQDVYLADGRAIFMAYDENGTFIEANEATSLRVVEATRRGVLDLWDRAVPFAEWWADNPALHRQLART